MKISNSDTNFNSTDYSIKESKNIVETNGQNQQNNANNASEKVEETKPISDKAIIEAIEKANKVMINHNTRAEISIHEKTKDIMIKIIDTESNEVLREYPPKKILDMVAKIWELAGLFVDERR